MVQLHLLVVEREGEEDRADDVVVRGEARHSCQGQAQTHTVVSEH